MKLAEQRIAEGKYGEAEQIVREVVSDRYDPNCRPALELLAHLSEPGYFNKTMGPKFIAKVEDVKKLLSDADGYYNSGRYDLAFKKYEQVLNLDPYNVAARRGEERIDLTQDALRRGGLTTKPARASSGRSRKAGKNRSANTARRSARSATPLRAMPAARRGSRTSSTASSFRRSNFATRASGRRSIFCVSRRRRTIRSTEGKRGVDIVLRTTSLGRPEAPAPLPGEHAASARRRDRDRG